MPDVASKELSLSTFKILHSPSHSHFVDTNPYSSVIDRPRYIVYLCPSITQITTAIMSGQATANTFARTIDRDQHDNFSTRPFQGSVQGFVNVSFFLIESLNANGSFSLDDMPYTAQDPAVSKALELQRVLDFLAQENPSYSYRRSESVPVAETRTTQYLRDWDQTFQAASRRRTR